MDRSVVSLRNIPRLLPDEILYSYIARIHLNSGPRSVKSTLKELFGAANFAIYSGLPTHLYHLHLILGDLLQCVDAKSVALRTTLLPYYRVFLEERRAEDLIARMAESNGGLKGELGLLASRIGAQNVKRWCPICVRADEKQFGFPYWHRSHQLPLVAFCAAHAVRLVEDNLTSRTLVLRLPPHSYSPEFQYSVNNCSEKIAPVAHLAVKFSQWSASILNADMTKIRNFSWAEFYRSKLRSRGFVAGKRNIAASRVIQELTAVWAEHLLLLSQRFEPEESWSNESNEWITKLYRSPKGMQHPVYHLLMLAFLFESPTEAFSEITSWQTPLPTPHLRFIGRRDATEEMILRDLNHGMTATKTAAHCRTSITTVTQIARTHGIHISTRPKVITDQVRGLVEELLLRGDGVSTIANDVHLSTVSVYRILRSSPLVGEQRKEILFKRVRDGYRSKLEKLLANGKQATNVAVKSAAPGIHAWLNRHDREWYEEQMLPAANRIRSTRTAPWPQRDARLSEQLRNAVAELLNSPCRPAQITLSELGRRTGSTDLLQKKLALLPLCADVLKASLESNEAFRIRKFKWSVEQLISTGKSPTFSNVMRHAAINCKFWKKMRLYLN